MVTLLAENAISGVLTFGLGYVGKYLIGVQGELVVNHSVLLELLEGW